MASVTFQPWPRISCCCTPPGQQVFGFKGGKTAETVSSGNISVKPTEKYIIGNMRAIWYMFEALFRGKQSLLLHSHKWDSIWPHLYFNFRTFFFFFWFSKIELIWVGKNSKSAIELSTWLIGEWSRLFPVDFPKSSQKTILFQDTFRPFPSPSSNNQRHHHNHNNEVFTLLFNAPRHCGKK